MIAGKDTSMLKYMSESIVKENFNNYIYKTVQTNYIHWKE